MYIQFIIILNNRNCVTSRNLRQNDKLRISYISMCHCVRRAEKRKKGRFLCVREQYKRNKLQISFLEYASLLLNTITSFLGHLMGWDLIITVYRFCIVYKYTKSDTDSNDLMLLSVALDTHDTLNLRYFLFFYI